MTTVTIIYDHIYLLWEGFNQWLKLNKGDPMVEGKWGHGCPQIDGGIIVESLALPEIKVKNALQIMLISLRFSIIRM